MKQQNLFRRTALVALLCLGVAPAAAFAESTLPHVHGLAFTSDGHTLVVPAHTGLVLYREGRWTKAPGPAHDFMGFSMAKNAIYSSGHPAPNTPLKNPLGLVKSTDGGKSWQQLGLSGESDFHLMAASYGTNAVYVFSTHPNSRMPQPGLYSTKDDGKSWASAAAAGLTGQLISLAVHPAEAATVGVGTVQGLHVSRDGGASFKRIGPVAAVTAVAFDQDGKHAFFATDKLDGLHRAALDGASTAAESLPRLDNDFVMYIAQNPADVKQLAIATRQRDVHLSRDGGKSWQQIARQGNGVSLASGSRGAAPGKSAGK